MLRDKWRGERIVAKIGNNPIDSGNVGDEEGREGIIRSCRGSKAGAFDKA